MSIQKSSTVMTPIRCDAHKPKWEHCVYLGQITIIGGGKHIHGVLRNIAGVGATSVTGVIRPLEWHDRLAGSIPHRC